MRWLLFLVILFALSSPCLAEEKPPGYDTPEEAIRAYVVASEEDNFEIMLSSCAPTTRGLMIWRHLANMDYYSQDNEAELNAIMDEHGIDEFREKMAKIGIKNILPQLSEKGIDDSEKREFHDRQTLEAVLRAALQIPDAPGLLRKIHDFSRKKHEQRQEETEGKTVEATRHSTEEILAGMQFHNMKIKGDTVTWQVDFELPSEFSFTFKCRRIDGRWFCDHLSPF